MLANYVQAVYDWQVVTANFDDLPVYSGVGDHYAGAVIYGVVTPSNWANTAPNVLYNDLKGDPIHFPQGALRVSMYTTGLYWVNAYALDGVKLGSMQLSNGLPWDYVDLRFDQPIGYITVVFGNMTPYYIDSLSFELVPEPASLASFAGMVGLFGVGCRKRRIVV